MSGLGRKQLQVVDPTQGGGQTGAHSHLPLVRRALPADVLECLRGWTPCTACANTDERERPGRHRFDPADCPTFYDYCRCCDKCAYGFVPSAQLIAAANPRGEASFAATFRLLVEAKRYELGRLVEPDLVASGAAARWVPVDEDVERLDS